MTLDEILVEIKNASSVVILAHEGPDGDAIGSCLALYHVINGMGDKRVDVLMKDYPANFSFMPGIENLKKETDLEKYDLAVCLDCPDLYRVDEIYQKYFETAEVKVVFDHHTKNAMFGDYNIVNHVSPSTSQVLMTAFEYWGLEINKDVLTCVMTGVITDTGGFKNSNITAETFELAAYAITKGVNLSKIYNTTMMLISKNKFELQKLAQERLEFYADGKVTITYMTLEDRERLGLKEGDHDGIVEIGRCIEGVEVSIFLYEKDNGFKASLRSNDYVNVAEVCNTFGGGGHIKAAGATMTKDLEESKNMILGAVIKTIK